MLYFFAYVVGLDVVGEDVVGAVVGITVGFDLLFVSYIVIMKMN